MEGLEVLAHIPEDMMVLDASRRGENVFALADDSPAFQAVRTMVEKIRNSKSEIRNKFE
jgi:septum formation inhibitor-activating ATPase MinD